MNGHAVIDVAFVHELFSAIFHQHSERVEGLGLQCVVQARLEISITGSDVSATLQQEMRSVQMPEFNCAHEGCGVFYVSFVNTRPVMKESLHQVFVVVSGSPVGDNNSSMIG